jgi:hypothetical protein
MGFGILASMLLLPLYYQQAQGKSALDAGLLIAPQGVGFLLGLLGIGRITDKISPRLLVLVGIGLTCAGTIAYTQLAQQPDGFLLGASLLVRGIGMSAATVPAIAAPYSGSSNKSAPPSAPPSSPSSCNDRPPPTPATSSPPSATRSGGTWASAPSRCCPPCCYPDASTKTHPNPTSNSKPRHPSNCAYCARSGCACW